MTKTRKRWNAYGGFCVLGIILWVFNLLDTRDLGILLLVLSVLHFGVLLLAPSDKER